MFRTSATATAVALAIISLAAIGCGDNDSGTSDERTAVPQPTATVPSGRSCAEGAATEACDLAADLGEAASAQDEAALHALVDDADPPPVLCTGEPGAPGSFTEVCEGAAPGETRDGFELALHGSEGTYLTRDQMKQLMSDELMRRVALASTGCGVDGCDTFVVAFRASEQPLAFYLAFERGDDGAYRLIGAGRSGDNADVILDGGRTFTVAGEAIFAAW